MEDKAAPVKVLRRSERNRADINYVKLNSGSISSIDAGEESDDEVIFGNQLAEKVAGGNGNISLVTSFQDLHVTSSESSLFPLAATTKTTDDRNAIIDISNIHTDEEPPLITMLNDRLSTMEGDIASLTDFVKTLYDHVRGEGNMQRDRLIDRLLAVEKDNTILIRELTNTLANIESLLIDKSRSINTMPVPSVSVPSVAINTVPSIQTHSVSVPSVTVPFVPINTLTSIQTYSGVGKTELDAGNGWTLVDKSKKANLRVTHSKDLLDANIRSQNYFGPLAYINNGPPEVNKDSDQISGIEKGIGPIPTSPVLVQTQNISSVPHQQQRRPPVVINQYPERERNLRKQTVVPGHSKYAEAHRHTTAIVSDSMVGSLRNNVLNSYLQYEDERVVVGKSPGATAKQICHNSIYTIMEEGAKSVVVVAGANDIINQSRGGKVPNEISIVEDILEIGRQAKEMGVKVVYISSIIVMSTHHRERIRKRVNKLLYDKCISEGFCYIDNSNIISNDLSNDNLHLNRNGLRLFMDNILGYVCRGYNPYLSDISDRYEIPM